MPPDNGSESASGTMRRGDAALRRTPDAAESVDTTAVAAFLRALAGRAERDAAFGRQIAALLAESGLLAAESCAATTAQPRRARHATTSPANADNTPPFDPFALLRDRGEAQLRTHLAALDLPALRQIIRVHRLDPARISARWATRERLVALIVDQVRARADHGKAFSRV